MNKMNGTRFARNGRCRFFICLGLLVFMFGMVAIFHSSQQQLDESRQQQLRCEQNQEIINEQLQALVESKFKLEKGYESERKEQMDERRNLEQKFKQLSETHEKLLQAHQQLEKQRNELVNTNAQSEKQHQLDANNMEEKLRNVRSELQEQQAAAIKVWKDKYDALLFEKQRLEKLLDKIGNEKKEQTHATTSKPKSLVSFKQQELIVPKKLPPPLSAPRKQKQQQQAVASSTEGGGVASKAEQQVLSAAKRATVANNSTTSTNANSVPLALPPNQQQRKLPENVAPIPAHFEDLLKNEQSNQQKTLDKPLAVNDVVGDVDAALEEGGKNDLAEETGNNNNRYANVVGDLEPKGAAAAPAADKEDSGAHEVKDQDLMNGENFNLPGDDDNFFDGAAKVNDAANDGNVDKHKEAENDDDDNMAAAADAGDIAVKNQNLLEADNLKNEIADDQGKEFADGLHIDDPNEEDEDDDYSNPGARQQDAKPVRN